MGFIKESFGVVLLLIAGLLASALYFNLPELKNISIEDIELHDINEITLEGFWLNGDLYIKNPSNLSIPVKNIEYLFILKETGQVIGNGNTRNFTLENEKTSAIRLRQFISWIPAGQTAINLITKDKVILVVKGQVYIEIPKVKTYALPFEKEIDIKPYTEQFISRYASPDAQEEAKKLLNKTDISSFLQG